MTDKRDAARYRYLRARDLDTIDQGGVFAGMTPDNVVLSGEELDHAVDLGMMLERPGPEPIWELPERLWAWCLQDKLGSQHGWGDCAGQGRVEYIRADLARSDTIGAKKVLEELDHVVSTVGLESQGVPAMLVRGVREAIALLRSAPEPVATITLDAAISAVCDAFPGALYGSNRTKCIAALNSLPDAPTSTARRLPAEGGAA